VPHLKPFSRSRVCKAVRTTKLYAIPESYLSANSMCVPSITRLWGLARVSSGPSVSGRLSSPHVPTFTGFDR
jgi:hypothetical protein